MRSCSVTKGMKIVAGNTDDYKKLARFHYRDNKLSPFAAIFAIRPAVGVIVYTMPTPGLELREIATNNLFTGLGRTTRLKLINKTVRCISRVIIEPRYRGLGLAGWLVRQTMPMMCVPIIEAMAIMGLVNPFFERAGMTAYKAPPTVRGISLTEAFSMVGIETKKLSNAKKVQQALALLPNDKGEFIESQIKCFLQSYGKRRNMPADLERTTFILRKLTERPVYYIWFNSKIKLSDHLEMEKI